MQAPLKRLEDAYPKDVRVIFRHYPLNIHDKAPLTAEAAEAAGAQGKFWPMHDLLFARQKEWAGLTREQAMEALAGYARELGLDVDRFTQEINSGRYSQLVQRKTQEAEALGLPGTPTLFLNGQYYDGPRADFAFVALAKFHFYRGRLFKSPPPMTIDPTQPYSATVVTNRGSFCIALYAQQAPKTVNSFIFLAKQGIYDGVPFHRVLPGFVAQTGDPTGGGIGGPGYVLADEFDPSLKHDGPGVVSMANGGPNTNGSQFFISYKALPELDGKHTIFGRVVQGMDIVEKLLPRDPQRDAYGPADVIERITIGPTCGQ